MDLSLTLSGNKTFYVSPNGNDRWSGTLPLHQSGDEGPFETLQAARDAVRRLKGVGDFDRPVTIMLLEGTYRLDGPLVLDARDSGTADSPITWCAFPGHQPQLSGGIELTDWQVHEGAIKKCSLSRKWNFRQLFFNGQRQVRARWPKRDAEDPLYGGWAWVEQTLPEGEEDCDTFRYAPVDVTPKRWAKLDQAELNVFVWYCWVNRLVPIKEINLATRTITVGPDPINKFMHLLKGNRFIIENVLEELNEPGEWCLDTQTGTVYFWPPEDGGEVVVPVTDRLIELCGSEEKPIHHVHVRGLRMTQTLSPFPEHLHPSFHSPCVRGEAIRLEHAEDCVIEQNVIHEVGGDAVRLQGYTARNHVVNNDIYHTGSAGISFASDAEGNTHTWADPDDLIRRAARYPRSIENLIAHNRIHHTGALKKNGGAIQAYGIASQDNRLAHNLIHHTADKGIVLQDGFGRVIVEYNHLHDLALEIADTGAIMTNRWFVIEGDEQLGKGNVFRFNLIRNVVGCGAYDDPKEGKGSISSKQGGRIWTPYYTWGIYFDNSAMYCTVYGNVIVGTVLGGVSQPVGDPKGNLFENNILVNSNLHQADLRVGGKHSVGNRFVRNILYYTDPQSSLMAIGSRTHRSFSECDYNLYATPGRHEPRIVGQTGDDESVDTFREWQQLGFDTHSIIADPLFVDPANGDYRLRLESPAFQLGFRPIDLSRVGPDPSF